jgi:hypothetical protein
MAVQQVLVLLLLLSPLLLLLLLSPLLLLLLLSPLLLLLLLSPLLLLLLSPLLLLLLLLHLYAGGSNRQKHRQLDDDSWLTQQGCQETPKSICNSCFSCCFS